MTTTTTLVVVVVVVVAAQVGVRDSCRVKCTHTHTELGEIYSLVLVELVELVDLRARNFELDWSCDLEHVKFEKV